MLREATAEAFCWIWCVLGLVSIKYESYTSKAILDLRINRIEHVVCFTFIPTLGLDGEQLFVDIGQCRQSCSTRKTKIHRKEFEAVLKANRSIDPVEVCYPKCVLDLLLKRKGNMSHFTHLVLNLLCISQLFLSMQRDESTKSCGGETHHCLPTRTVIERHMTMLGLQQVAVIEDCTCRSQLTQYCHRVEENVVYFPGTPFETTVDIGRCSGSCTDSGE